MSDNDSGTTRPWTPVFLEGLPLPAGAYSPGVRAGPLLFISGQVPKDPATGQLVGDDVAAQTRQVFANLERVLAAAGGSLANLAAMTVHLADVDEWGAFDAVYRELMRPPFPTRTVVGSQLRGIRVEISAIAWMG
ncbi:MAG: RidA family protein [Gemmatimonadaceae bacterium]|jgi:2-iminobutanoate/2-iminopropanoate deaminase|nr:RidA family protein [Gemmatimonadaceae bacterium]